MTPEIRAKKLAALRQAMSPAEIAALKPAILREVAAPPRPNASRQVNTKEPGSPGGAS